MIEAGDLALSSWLVRPACVKAAHRLVLEKQLTEHLRRRGESLLGSPSHPLGTLIWSHGAMKWREMSPPTTALRRRHPTNPFRNFFRGPRSLGVARDPVRNLQIFRILLSWEASIYTLMKLITSLGFIKVPRAALCRLWLHESAWKMFSYSPLQAERTGPSFFSCAPFN